MDELKQRARELMRAAFPENDNTPRPKVDYFFAVVLLMSGIAIGMMFERNSVHQEISGNQNIQVGNASDVLINQIGNDPTIDWGDLTGATRDIYRSEIFAHFPWALGPMKANDWTKIQEWLLEQRGIVNTNVRDIIRTRRDGDMPRQVATLLYSYEYALSYIGAASSAHLTATWGQAAPTDWKERQAVWKEITVAAVQRAHGQKWADVVKSTLDQYQ